MKVLVTGGRGWKPGTLWPKIIKALRDIDAPTGKRLTIIHGDAPGADQEATHVAELLGANLYRFPAEWAYYRQFGRPKIAGHLRNAEMLNTCEPDIVLAFPEPKSRGTWDMVNLAHKRGVRVRVVEP